MPKSPLHASLLLIMNIDFFSVSHAKGFVIHSAPDLKICSLQGLLHHTVYARQGSVLVLVLFTFGIHRAFSIDPNLVMLAGSWRLFRSSCF